MEAKAKAKERLIETGPKGTHLIKIPSHKRKHTHYTTLVQTVKKKRTCENFFPCNLEA